MEKNYRRDSYKKAQEIEAAERFMADAVSDVCTKKDNDDNSGYRKYDKPKKTRYSTTISCINFDVKKRTFDYMSGVSLLADIRFDAISIPVYMNQVLLGGKIDKPTVIGYINKIDMGLEREVFTITVNEQWVDSFKAVEAASKLEMNIKTLADRNGDPFKFLSFEVRATR